jgi:DNA-nicking Smr family endonuclease
MKNRGKAVWQAAAVGALAVTLSTSAFAAPQRNDNRGNTNRQQTQSRNTRDNDNGSYRDNQRVNTTGRVTSFSRGNGGYRVQLDRGRESYWIPESRMHNRGRDLRVGISVVLGGVFRGGRVDVDAVSW